MQLDGFATIGGSGFSERLFVSDGGNVDLTGATIFGVEELRGNLLANQFTLTGVADGQFINAQGGDDVILGALGSDTINAGTGKDALSGDDGNDSLLGGDDVDTLLGGNGNDLLNGGAGTDSLSGGAGNDNFRVTLVGEVSGLAETVDGGADIDALDFQSENAGGAANITSLVLTSVETLMLGGTELTLRAGQLGSFTTIHGTGIVERVYSCLLRHSGPQRRQYCQHRRVSRLGRCGQACV